MIENERVFFFGCLSATRATKGRRGTPRSTLLLNDVSTRARWRTVYSVLPRCCAEETIISAGHNVAEGYRGVYIY